ncbi:MAG TPA: rod shape-determining protein MreC [Rhizomicrobium sp.]|jgi:rod shape-determining protein MreC|nr:rod shape-determining protein MreC [Rhizomicrobium sp.]
MANGTFRITRGRGNAQIPLAIAAIVAIVIVILGRAQSGLFDRARAELTDWMSPALKVVYVPVDAANKWMSGISNFFSVYQENIRLKEENARLRKWQMAANMMDERVKRYQLLLRAVPDPALSSIVARVIGRASRPFDQTIVLDAGKRHGVKPGQAVVDARGMIGRIFLAGDHTSWVVLITDLNSRIPVTIKPGNAQAILAGDNSPTPRLEDFSQNAALRAGDSIVTSGDGGILPAGLVLGTLVQTDRGLRVLLQADPANVDDVEVLDYKAPIEPLPASSVKDLPAAVAGMPPAVPPSDEPGQSPAPPPLAVPQAPAGPKPATAQSKPAPGATPPAKPAVTVVTPPTASQGNSTTGDSTPDQDQ